jgi:hypothetical protein
MNSEIIKFELDFYLEYIDNDFPQARILVDSEIKFDGVINNTQSSVVFSHTLTFDQPHQLIINRYGKTNKPQQLTIKKISIDGINIRNIIWAQSYNEPIYPEPWASQQREKGLVLEERIPGETCFGHNSIWTLKFTSPFYKFLYAWINNELDH